MPEPVSVAPRGAANRRTGIFRFLLMAMLAGSAFGISLSSEKPPGAAAPAAPATGLKVLASQLTGAGADRIHTPAGSFILASGAQFFLRNGGAIKQVASLAQQVGKPISLGVEAGRVVWVVVETKEPIDR